MKVAYTGWTWFTPETKRPKEEFELFLREVADLRYSAVENFAFIKRFFDGNADEINALLKKYKLEMANLYLHFSDNAEADIANAKEYIEFMKKIGATYMNLQAVMWKDKPHDRPIDKAAVLEYARRSDEVGKLCNAAGIKACFHPHANTNIYTEEELDLFVENIEHAYLCLDTAHTVIGGMDPVLAFKKYADRLAYVHFKDVDPTPDPENQMHRFRPLGIGTVDFVGVYNVLVASGYDGVICVELDRQPVSNYKSAQISRDYLHNALGL